MDEARRIAETIVERLEDPEMAKEVARILKRKSLSTFAYPSA
jgi:hypothetical protein